MKSENTVQHVPYISGSMSSNTHLDTHFFHISHLSLFLPSRSVCRASGEVNNDIVVEMKTDKPNEEAGLLNKRPSTDQVITHSALWWHLGVKGHEPEVWDLRVISCDNLGKTNHQCCIWIIRSVLVIGLNCYCECVSGNWAFERLNSYEYDNKQCLLNVMTKLRMKILYRKQDRFDMKMIFQNKIISNVCSHSV